jgi:hypothetical protein
MPPRTEMLGDGTVGGEKPLSVTRGLEPLHALLPLTGGLMGVLRPVIEVAVLTMFHPGQNLSFGDAVAFEFIHDDHAGGVNQAFEELTKELVE